MKKNHQQIWNIAVFEDGKDQCIHVLPHPVGKQRKALAEILEFIIKQLNKRKK